MDPLTIVIASGFIGGLVIALLLARLNRTSEKSDPFAAERPSTDIINMARIRVAGIGGLGFVAVAVVVAAVIPRIRLSLTLGLALGALFGLTLVLWRKRAGPMPSSGQRPGANTTLSIDVPTPPDNGNPDSVNTTEELHASDVRRAASPTIAGGSA